MGRWYSDSDYHSSSETSDSGLRDEYDDQRWDPDKFRALERVNIELEEMYEAERVAEDGTSLYTDPASTEEAGPPAPSQPRPEADAGKPADEAESGARAADTLPDLDLEQLLLPAGMEVVPDTTVDTGRELKKLMRQPRYFAPRLEEDARRCFKCGGTGHIARECPNPARPRPCYYCASFEHNSYKCPRALCHRCSQPGHRAADCPHRQSRPPTPTATVQRCLRCGRTSCSMVGAPIGRGWCTATYTPDDLGLVRCAQCGMRGHLSCAPPPQEDTRLSCCLCGALGHDKHSCTGRGYPPSPPRKRWRSDSFFYGRW